MGMINKKYHENFSGYSQLYQWSIDHIPDVPYTLNMKKAELAVKKTIEGRSVLNKDAVEHPKGLNYFKNFAELNEA